MISKYIERIDAFLLSLESRFGLLFTSIILAFIIVGFDMLYITPNFEIAYHGNYFAGLSSAPFDFSQTNPLRNRILPSLLGYLFFLRGELFFIMLLIFAISFIAIMYFIYRRKDYSAIDSLLFTGLIAFSSTMYIQLASPGYTDIALYFFIFLTFSFIKKIGISAIFFSLALLTHESSFFLFPALILYSYCLHKDKKRDVLKHFLALVIATFPLIIYRIWVAKHTPVDYDLNFYFNAENMNFCISKILPLMPAGAFYAFKLFWFFPIYVLYKTFQKKEYAFFYLILSIIICDIAQLVIAYDITRMLCLGFPAILLAAEKVKSSWDSQKFTFFLFSLTLFNFLIMQYYMSAGGLIPLLPSPITLILFLSGIN